MRQMRGFVALALVLILCGCGPAASRAAQPSGTQTASLPQEEQVWVSFEDNGGTGRLPEALSAPQGEAVVLPAAELSARLDGARLRFVGWAAEADASAPDYLPGESLTLGGGPDPLRRLWRGALSGGLSDGGGDLLRGGIRRRNTPGGPRAP